MMHGKPALIHIATGIGPAASHITRPCRMTHETTTHYVIEVDVPTLIPCMPGARARSTRLVPGMSAMVPRSALTFEGEPFHDPASGDYHCPLCLHAVEVQGLARGQRFEHTWYACHRCDWQSVPA